MDPKRNNNELKQRSAEPSKVGDNVDVQWGEIMFEPLDDRDVEVIDKLCKGRHCETSFEKF